MAFVSLYMIPLISHENSTTSGMIGWLFLALDGCRSEDTPHHMCRRVLDGLALRTLCPTCCEVFLVRSNGKLAEEMGITLCSENSTVGSNLAYG